MYATNDSIQNIQEYFFHSTDDDLGEWRHVDNKATSVAYGNAGISFIVGALRSAKLDDAEYRLSLSDNQSTRCTTFISRCESTSGPTILDLHSLFWFLLSDTIPASNSNKFACPLSCFYAVHALRDDGRLKSPHNLTHIFAVFKFLIRGASLYEASIQENYATVGIPA